MRNLERLYITYHMKLNATRIFGFLMLLMYCCFSLNTQAQLVSGESFMQGTYLEVGVAPCGSYGTQNAPPAGYHARGGATPGLGFVADMGRDGWTVGTPDYCGDYFLPGSPVEGWGIQIGSTSYRNTNGGSLSICGPFDIPGSIISYTATASSKITVWDGTLVTVTSGTGSGTGMHITQTTTLPNSSLYFITNVEMCNTTDADMVDVYYGRNVDPDNDQPSSGDFTTINHISNQAGSGDCQSLVTSEGLTYHCFLGIGAVASNSRVTHGSFSTLSGDISTMYLGGAGRDTTLGATATADEAISIGFYWPRISAHGCVNFSYVHVLNSADVAVALASIATPVISADGSDISASLRDTACGLSTVTLTANMDSSYVFTWGPDSILDTTAGPTVHVTAHQTSFVTLTGVGHCGNFS
jgi:hypothetical protein